MLISSIEGHRIWANTYDAGPNPVLALEMRLLRIRLQSLPRTSFLDVAAGTGRWMTYLGSLGHRVFGIDLCPEMLASAACKPSCAGMLALGDLRRLPFRHGSIDTALCSFALGYVESLSEALRELARVSTTVIVSDLHPQATAAGWTRSFRAAGIVYELQHYVHSLQDLERAAARAGLARDWATDAYFGAPEREIFSGAGKASCFEAAARVPAVLISAWSKR